MLHMTLYEHIRSVSLTFHLVSVSFTVIHYGKFWSINSVSDNISTSQLPSLLLVTILNYIGLGLA